MVTADSLAEAMIVTCEVGGDVVQQASTADLVFDPPTLVSYVSTIMTLHPGDVIPTETPAGVGHGRIPPRYLAAGQTVVTRIPEVGSCHNSTRNECYPSVPRRGLVRKPTFRKLEEDIWIPKLPSSGACNNFP